MWPHLLGPSWVGDVLLSAGLVAAIIVAIAVLLSRAEEPAGHAGATHDWLQTAWHRYEQGDLTPWEFERLVNPRPAVHSQHAALADRPMPAGHAGAAHDAAAD
jgi:hypothetical protein